MKAEEIRVKKAEIRARLRARVRIGRLAGVVGAGYLIIYAIVSWLTPKDIPFLANAPFVCANTILAAVVIFWIVQYILCPVTGPLALKLPR